MNSLPTMSWPQPTEPCFLGTQLLKEFSQEIFCQSLDPKYEFAFHYFYMCSRISNYFPQYLENRYIGTYAQKYQEKGALTNYEMDWKCKF